MGGVAMSGIQKQWLENNCYATLELIGNKYSCKKCGTGPCKQGVAMTDIDKTLAERGKRYGEFKSNAKISQNIKQAMFMECQSDKIASMDDDMLEALDMIAHKIARILNGDPDYIDNWVDIAGYAKLVADRLNSETTKESKHE